jgi:hypothetical protein
MRSRQRLFMSACALAFPRKSAGAKRSLDPTETIFSSLCKDVTSERSDRGDSSA